MIYPLTVQAERRADKPAVIHDRPDGGTLVWSYAELNRQANRLAHVFRDLGLKPGERFIWCGPNSPAVVAVGHARAKVGATAVPLNHLAEMDEFRLDAAAAPRRVVAGHPPDQLAKLSGEPGAADRVSLGLHRQ
jgi:acyl-coenzyme A synthetase/AMP-(fatty) acid ligase